MAKPKTTKTTEKRKALAEAMDRIARDQIPPIPVHFTRYSAATVWEVAYGIGQLAAIRILKRALDEDQP